MATNDVQPYSDLSKISPSVSRVSFDFWAQPVLQLQDGTYSCPGFVGPTYADSAWDKVTLGYEYVTPGVCDVVIKKARDVDKKKATGQDGARLTIHGIEPAWVEIRVTIWTPEQLRKLRDLWAILFPGPTKAKNPKKTETAWDCDHPEFRTHKIKSLVFIGGDVDQGKFPRSRAFIMRAMEYMPPGKAKATKSPVQSKGSTRDPEKATTPGSVKKNRGP